MVFPENETENNKTHILYKIKCADKLIKYGELLQFMNSSSRMIVFEEVLL